MKKPKSHIFCPNCSSKNDIEQNYCRFCGLDLTEASESLTAQLAFKKNARQLKRLQVIKKLNEIALTGLIITVMCAIGVLLHALVNQVLFPGWKVLPVIMIAFTIFDFVTRQMRRRGWRKISRENESAKVDLATGKETAKLLEEKPFAPAASVAMENSTELLFTENQTKKMR